MNARARRSGRCWCAALTIVVAACHSARADGYHQGEKALAAGDLAAALRGFDGVPVTDLRYPEARLAAAALERRLRRQKEMLLLGLRLRSEWRDDEAIAAFAGALDAWPANLETEQLIAATESRRSLLAGLLDRRTEATLPVASGDGRSRILPRGARDPSPAPTLVSRTAPRGGAEPDPTSLSAIAAAPPAGSSAAAAQRVGPPATSQSLGRAAGATDSVGAELAQIEARMFSGELDQVLGDLFALQRLSPDDPRVTVRLARLLQQRGLVRYGQGQVSAAIADLQRATELDPSLQSARVLFELAAKELATPGR